MAELKQIKVFSLFVSLFLISCQNSPQVHRHEVQVQPIEVDVKIDVNVNVKGEEDKDEKK